MKNKKRRQELIDFIDAYQNICIEYDCAINFDGSAHMVDFKTIRELKDYMVGEIGAGLKEQYQDLLDTVDICLDGHNYDKREMIL